MVGRLGRMGRLGRGYNRDHRYIGAPAANCDRERGPVRRQNKEAGLARPGHGGERFEFAKRRQNLTKKCVDKMFKNYPPKPGKK